MRLDDRLEQEGLDLLRERQKRAILAFHLERSLHDVNNLFHAIELRVSFLRVAEKLTPDGQALLAEVERIGAEARVRVDSIGLKDPSEDDAEASADLYQAVSRAAALARRDGCVLSVSPEVSRAPRVGGSADGLAVLFSLLFDNAREAGGRALVVDAVVEPEQVIALVADDGPGFPDQDLSRPLRPFFTTKGNGHLGHGLALAAHLARRYGGSLAIANADPTRGARVTVTLRR